MEIALIVPVMKRFDLFTDMIRSVDHPIMPYVIDNYHINKGVAAAWNEGLFKAARDGHRYAIITNDDVYFYKNSIEKLYSAIRENDHVIISADQNLEREDLGLIDDSEEDNFYSAFFCYAIDIKKIWKNCGLFDENFFPAYFEDNDMRRRIALAGLTMAIHTGAKVYHHHSATQNADEENQVCPPQQWDINQNYFIAKWGDMPGKEKFPTPFNDPNKTIKDWEKR